MKYYHNSNDIHNPRPHKLIISHNQRNLFDKNGRFIQPIFDWLHENIGKAYKDWRIKRIKNSGREITINFLTESDALAFKLRWDE